MRKRRKKEKKSSDKKVLFKHNDKDLKKIRRKRKTQSLKQNFSIRKISMWVFLLAIFIALLSLTSKIFNRGSNEIVQETETVIGLDDIPTYPNSTFLFIDDLENQSVKDMLAGGQSAYYMNSKSNFKDVKTFYANELISRGWNLVLNVEIGAEDKRYGQYWVKEDKGLRIYSRYNDIWYETITPEEAKNGLSNRVSEEIEIDMLLAGSDYQDLLPDYPWQIKIPKDYLISYEVSEFEDFRAVNFQRISTGQFITIYPVGYWGSKALDYQLDDYTKILSQGTEDWDVVNTTVTSWRGNSSLKGTIAASGNQKEVLILKNERNKVTYILNTADSSDPLYDYIIGNIKYLGQEDNS
ncbi:MAG: hypothetical protein PHG60_00635 [Candidatus Dojkabacteria bacterium]|jgi:hypothetical protein|nr:hypothetical protein [Candidatus Dojkabacteria bacterium]MDD2270083.1 hypothetical protein [Candidatus Dojkabacteria bacterium]